MNSAAIRPWQIFTFNNSEHRSPSCITIVDLLKSTHKTVFRNWSDTISCKPLWSKFSCSWEISIGREASRDGRFYLCQSVKWFVNSKIKDNTWCFMAVWRDFKLKSDELTDHKCCFVFLWFKVNWWAVIFWEILIVLSDSFLFSNFIFVSYIMYLFPYLFIRICCRYLIYEVSIKANIIVIV